MLDPGSIRVTGKLQDYKEKHPEMVNQCCCLVDFDQAALICFTAKHTMYSVLLDSAEVKVGSKTPGKLN